MVKVCFVAENAWPAIDPHAKKTAGGMETQAWAFAQALCQLHECEVSFVVCSDETPRAASADGIPVDGVLVRNRPAFFENLRRTVAASCRIQHRPPWIHIRRWTWHLLWQLPLLVLTRPFRSDQAERFARRDFYCSLSADIVIAFGVSRITTDIITAAKKAGKRAIISCASNDDLRAEYHPGSDFINDYGEPAADVAEGLQSADAIFVQTELQQQLAERNLGISAHLLPNPILSEWTRWAEQSEALLNAAGLSVGDIPERFVLWTGRTDHFHKRPHLALQVAATLPDIPFWLVLNVTNRDIENELRSTATPNVRFLKPLPHPSFVALMSRATVFLNTGSAAHEGFPNVFLQAGVLGIPVASAAADFGILSSTGIGKAFADDIDALTRFVRESLNTPTDPESVTLRTLRLQSLFGPGAIAEKLWQLLQSICNME
ncbi:MAG: glycosyltransferase [Planctomycetaceae bacterium]|nr:glycosyltransferase [Planctomycetaceae bacterium]